MRVWAMTKIFPNAARPLTAPFFRQQFVELAKLCELRVAGLIPWFPGASLTGNRTGAGEQSGVPARETIDGLEVFHPRVFHPPKVGVPLLGAAYTASLLPLALKLRGEVDVIFGTWAYPDGFAAVALGEILGIPAVVQVIGSDIHQLTKRPGVRWNLRWALPRCSRVVSVSRQLGETCVELGLPAERLEVVVTGVDRELFCLVDRAQARAAVGADPKERLIVSVGRLEAEKGAFDLLDAFERIAPRDASLRLVMLGDGSREDEVRERAATLGGRVSVLGSRPLDEVARWVQASDLVTLPSWAEGTPNALMEAFSCGRRVVSTRVGGIPDMVTSEVLGELVDARDVEALAEALWRVVSTPYDAEAVTHAYPLITWPQNAARIHDVLKAAVDERQGG
ncbi:MAG: glycosyltransferase [Deltaproteobacteria bacterium]|nr:glycosyltransferase [Deltaproteobacteria bacterium]